MRKRSLRRAPAMYTGEGVGGGGGVHPAGGKSCT